MQREELQKKIAEKLDRIGVLQRDSERLVTAESSKNRLNYLKDYMYVGLASLGVIISLVTSDRSADLIESFPLLITGAFLLVAATVYALIARARLIHDAETYNIFIENQYASKYQIIEQLAQAQTEELVRKLVNDLDGVRASKPPKQLKVIASAHEYILVLFIPGLLLVGMSFFIKTFSNSI